jgi:ABC-2 type transport system permease protein
VHSLPPFWYHASHLNPFFFMIDGFRYGFFGRADVAASVSLLWSGCFFVAVSILCLWILKRGWRLRY